MIASRPATSRTVQTVVTVNGKEKPQDVKVEYPAGKTVKDPDLKIEYKTYEDKVEIKALVQRAKGDSGPLSVPGQRASESAADSTVTGRKVPQ